MKNFFSFQSLALAVLMFVCNLSSAWAEDRTPDYTTADGKDWLFNHQINTKRCQDEPAMATNIDLFYIYPTVCMQQTAYSQTHNGFVSIDDEGMRKDTIALSSAKGAFFTSGMTFASYTQVYAPFYRQANMVDVNLHSNNDSILADYLYNGLAYQDVKAALDYYFSTLNPAGNRRPFILAGHSQGSALLRVVMEHYFSQPDKVALLDSMVACYAIGFGIGNSVVTRIETATGVKIANDAASTKVYVSWNTEGPGGCGVSPLWPKDAIAVNPLTWTTNGVAEPQANTGARQSILVDEVRPGLYGAEISNHGTVICREMPERNYMDPSAGLGDRCLHAYDYAAYWNNIAENGMQRAAKMAGWKPCKVTGLEDHTYIAQYMYKVGYMPYEAIRAGATYWIPKTATWAQAIVMPTEGYKLASGKSSDKVSIDVTDAMDEVEIDVSGHGAKWSFQRKPDYSYANDWMLNHALKPIEAKGVAQEPEEDTGVDMFYVYPTIADSILTTTVGGCVDIDDVQIRGNEQTHIGGGWSCYATQGRVFNGMTHVYAPFYRQLTLETAINFAASASDLTVANTTYADSVYASVAYADVVDALDAYFKYWNNGRKFILAAHSQGSAVLRNLMEHYFTQDDAHKALLKNLVCSYQIGYGVGTSWLTAIANNTKYKDGLPNGLQFANNDKGTGCIVSWNLTGPNATGKSMLLPEDAVAINPLTWTTNATPANKSLNLGTAYKQNPDSIVAGEISAVVNTARGTVECAEAPTSMYVPLTIFGGKSMHESDYSVFWVNLRENIRERIHTATGKYPIPSTYITVNVPRTGKATIYSDKNLIIPADVKVYGLANHGTYLNHVNTAPAANAIIPANQGYLVEAIEGSYTFIKTDAAVTANFTSCLSGVTVDTPASDISGTVYTLATGIKGMGFYRFNGSTLAAGKAFYIAPSTETKEFIALGEETAIESIHNSEFIIHNDGKYIENGRVVIVKNNKKFNVAGQRMK